MRRRLSTAFDDESVGVDAARMLDTPGAAAYPCRPSNRPTMCLFWRRFAQLCAPRDRSHEAHLSAQQSTSSENSRISSPHGHPLRARSAGPSPRERPKAPERLSPNVTCKRSAGRSLRHSVSTTNQTSIASIRMRVALPMRCLPYSFDRMQELPHVSDSP